MRRASAVRFAIATCSPWKFRTITASRTPSGLAASAARGTLPRPMSSRAMPQPTLAPEAQSRAGAVVMNSEYETFYEMFDPVKAAVWILPWCALLAKMGGVF